MQIKVDSSPLEVTRVQENYINRGEDKLVHQLFIEIESPTQKLEYYKDLFSKASTIEVPAGKDTFDTFTIEHSSVDQVDQFTKNYTEPILISCGVQIKDE